MAAVVSKGDFVEMSFTASIAGGEVFEKTGKPLLIVVGAGQVIAGLDELLVGTSEGVQKSATIPKEKAFGERKPEMVKLIPFNEFQKHGVSPVAGMPVDIDGVPARVQSVSGGRVRIDFNPELAGYDLHYDYKVEKVISSPEAKVDALKTHVLEKNGSAELSGKVKVSFDKQTGVVTLTVPDSVAKNTDYLVAKTHFVAQALGHVPEVKNVLVNEEYSKANLKEEESS